MRLGSEQACRQCSGPALAVQLEANAFRVGQGPGKTRLNHIAPMRRSHSTPAGPITTPLAVQAACDARDSLAKVVYARLFDWLVAAVNAAVDEAHDMHTNGGPAAGGARGRQAEHLSIGLLDIYGFESFEVCPSHHHPCMS